MTAPWASGPFLALDCETTGVDPFTDRIVEVAVAEVQPNGDVSGAFRTIVDPGVPIPDGAAEVHGITTERAKAEGMTPALALEQVAGWLYLHGVKAPVVMFNARFDWPLVMAEAERHGVDVPCFAPILDPMLVDRYCDRFRKGSRRLSVVADHYGVELGDAAHGALADAVASAKVMRALVDRFPELAELSLASLWMRQVRWHEDWREGFEDHLRRTRDPEAVVIGGWPIPVSAERRS